MMDKIFERRIYPVDGICVSICYSPEGQLSFYGLGNGFSGQIQEFLLTGTPNPFFSKTQLRMLYNIWERWNLNTLRAGTPKQMEKIREWRTQGIYKYEEVCEKLREIDLYIDKGYRYGSGWLKEEVPEGILRWLFTLPGTGHTYEDIFPIEIEESALNIILNL